MYLFTKNVFFQDKFNISLSTIFDTNIDHFVLRLYFYRYNQQNKRLRINWGKMKSFDRIFLFSYTIN